ncbi:MAG: hypothetical protein HRU18_02645 [Pseudoalteromonas sp.]|uniref:hypothetical protein n=1 Tax=Pseudoalteromonas sp. TaxID=53249 RepID=UPI001D925C1F|nr:hypothetical protein [Pseudoalteromonas sp.]NRA77082.1 hypothetical protein [Pseudoalteromonas sp.]
MTREEAEIQMALLGWTVASEQEIAEQDQYLFWWAGKGEIAAVAVSADLEITDGEYIRAWLKDKKYKVFDSYAELLEHMTND